MNERKARALAEADRDKSPLRWWDWALFAVLAAVCYVLYAQADLLATGNRSWFFFEGGVGGFYDRVQAWTGDYGANYMPSTFLLFAIWVLPLKLFGVQPPAVIAESRVPVTLWYKALPVLFFLAAAWLIYRICLELGMRQRRAKLCLYAFLTMPIAFYSQFIFSQYDIFTVFFCLLGIFFWLRRKSSLDMLWFALSLGAAVTFKYYAVAVFFIFLLVREKNLLKIALWSAVMAVPFAVEYLVARQSQSFTASVFQFGAVSYISQGDFVTAIGEVSWCKAACCFMIAWAYFVRAEGKREETAWALYLCCGFCFGLYGLATWHPQWLLFATPFWLLSAYMSRHTEKFLLVDILYFVVFLLFVNANVAWQGAVDDAVLDHGVLQATYMGVEKVRHWSDFMPSLDDNTLYSALFVLLLTMFVFKHPRQTAEDPAEENVAGHVWWLRARILLTVLLFTVPALMAWRANTAVTTVHLGGEPAQFTDLMEYEVCEQRFVPDRDLNVTAVEAAMGTYEGESTSDVVIRIREEDAEDALSETRVNASALLDRDYATIDVPDVRLTAGKAYIISFSVPEDADWDEYMMAICRSDDPAPGDGTYAVVEGEQQPYNYCVRLTCAN